MKNVTLLVNTLFVIIMFSCHQVQNQGKINMMNISRKDSIKDKNSISAEDKILMQDTLFSFFTSNLRSDQINRMLDTLERISNHFVNDSRLFSEYLNYSFHDASHYYKQPCYKFIFNGKTYLFDIKFDHDPTSIGWNYQQILTDRLDFIILYYKSEKNILRDDIINLYQKKYGVYQLKKEFTEYHSKPLFKKDSE